MAKQRAGAKKLRRSSKDKPYYAGFRVKLSAKKLRKRLDREKRIAAAQAKRQ